MNRSKCLLGLWMQGMRPDAIQFFRLHPHATRIRSGDDRYRLGFATEVGDRAFLIAAGCVLRVSLQSERWQAVVFPLLVLLLRALRATEGQRWRRQVAAVKTAPLRGREAAAPVCRLVQAVEVRLCIRVLGLVQPVRLRSAAANGRQWVAPIRPPRPAEVLLLLLVFALWRR